MISVFVFYFIQSCCLCFVVVVFFTGLDVDFVVSFFVVIKHFCFFFVLCRKRKEKKYNVLGQVEG